ncbi:phosphatase PAP2 family protein [Promicromonospora sp. Populi]|uniref:phosphatase PAP2 family protein n=1 Tax=Promicromonospora sp. Populi TaxID=3239420 RepID=UPI0034E2E8AE
MTDRTLPPPEVPQPARGHVVGTAKGYPPPTSVGTPMPGRTAGLRPRVGPRLAAAAAAVLALWGVWATWDTFVASESGQRVDQLALEGAATGQGALMELAGPVLGVVSTSFVGLGLAVAVVLALARGRWWLAAQVAILVAGSNLSTQVIKVILDRPPLLDSARADINTLPSGHTTVAASVAAGLLIAVPRRWRPLVAVAGAAYTAATGVSTLIGQWHRPSDVAAAILVVLAWSAGVCALSSPSSLDEPRRGGEPGSSTAVGLLLVGAVGTGVLAVGALGSVGGYDWGLPGGDLTAYMGGMLGVVAVTLASFALLLMVRQSTARPQGS